MILHPEFAFYYWLLASVWILIIVGWYFVAVFVAGAIYFRKWTPLVAAAVLAVILLYETS